MIKKIFKKIIPEKILKLRRDFLSKRKEKRYSSMKLEDVFKEIYYKKLWTPENEKKNNKFYSGIGSRNEEFTEVYIDKIKNFLLSLPSKPSVVDLGCGDFFIGSRLRKYCNKFIAIDIFEELIELNKKKFENQNVDFQALDITKDPLPSGDICFLRNVLQHFSNDHIQRFLKLMVGKYKYLIITEHLPKEEGYFKPNVDKITGPNIRIQSNSGVILTEPPFNLKFLEKKNVFDIYPKKILGFEGVLRTTIFKFF